MLAYWLQLGKTLHTLELKSGTHIQYLYKNITKFPISKQDVETMYNVYDETLTVDGKAAHNIIINMLKLRYITIRYHESSNIVHINTWKLTNTVKDSLFTWASITNIPNSAKLVLNEYYTSSLPKSTRSTMNMLRFNIQASTYIPVLLPVKLYLKDL